MKASQKTVLRIKTFPWFNYCIHLVFIEDPMRSPQPATFFSRYSPRIFDSNFLHIRYLITYLCIWKEIYIVGIQVPSKLHKLWFIINYLFIFYFLAITTPQIKCNSFGLLPNSINLSFFWFCKSYKTCFLLKNLKPLP